MRDLTAAEWGDVLAAIDLMQSAPQWQSLTRTQRFEAVDQILGIARSGELQALLDRLNIHR